MKGFIAFGLGVCLAAAGCGTANKLVGTWVGEFEQMGRKTVFNNVINSDGSFQQTTTISAPELGKDTSAKVIVSGTWESKEETKVLLTAKDVKVEGIPAAQAEMAKKFLGPSIGKAIETTIKWNGNDEIALSSSSGPAITLKRQ